jgi:hypothetical protein
MYWSVARSKSLSAGNRLNQDLGATPVVRLPIKQQLTQRRRERRVNADSGLMPPYPWLPKDLRDGDMHINSAPLHS